MAIVQEFDLNMIPDSAPVVVHVNQYDEGEGRFEIHLYDGNVPYVPAAGAEAIIQGTKPDGKGFDYNATLSGSTVTADVTKQMTAVAGVVRVQVVITEGDDVTGTFVFGMDVQKSGLPADTDMSASEYQVVMQLLETAEGINNNPPKIGVNGHWWVWDASTGAYVDSGVDASITVQISAITMLSPDATPYVENEGTDTDPIFHLYIPRGYTGNGIQTIEKTGTAGLVDTYTVTFTNGTTTTFMVTNGRNTDQVTAIPTASAALVGTIYQYIGESTSSYTHGFYYECVNDGGVYRWVNIPVGNDPVAITSTDPYTYRQGKGNLADMEIVGASVGWNQLVPNSGSDLSVTIPSGRKYIMKKNGTYTVGQSDGTALTGLTGGTDNVHDLSPMLGSTIADAIYAMEQATAGAGVAFFRKYFPKDYYAYDPGSIQSVCIASRKVVGKNLFNPNAAIEGKKLSANGGLDTSSGYATSDYIQIGENTPIYCKNVVSNSYGYTICYYDSNKTFISKQSKGTGDKFIDDTFTTPSNCCYVRVTTDVTNYKYSTMVAFGSTATPYEPYTETAYPFDSTKELRGMFTLVGGELKANGDIYTADGNIQKKYGIVDLGTLTWTYDSGNTLFYSNGVTDKKYGNLNLMCAKYTTSTAYTTSDKIVWGKDNAVRVYIKDTAYSDAATFKTAMSGVYLVYELATPTTESAQPYQNPQRAYIDGTEEFTDGLTRDVMIPVGNNTTYQQDKILPSVEDYVDAVAEPKADISAIGTNETGATASKAYTTGQHFYKDGKFCTAIAAIASNAAFTLNTNYVEGTIAEALEAINVSGGHTIVDSSGSSMTARSKLKFANATVTDDPANDQTVITTNPASAVQTATLAAENFIKHSPDSGVYYITRSGFCEIRIKDLVAKAAGQGLLVASGIPNSAFDGIIMGTSENFEDGTAFYINKMNGVTNLYALIPDTNPKYGSVLYMTT